MVLTQGHLDMMLAVRLLLPLDLRPRSLLGPTIEPSTGVVRLSQRYHVCHEFRTRQVSLGLHHIRLCIVHGPTTVLQTPILKKIPGIPF